MVMNTERYVIITKATKVVLVALLIMYLVLAMLLPSGPHGESGSFMLPVVAFTERLDLAITDSDYELACELFPGHIDYLNFYYYDFMPTGNDGQKYPYYFGIYSYLCIPAFFCLRLFRLDTVYAFPITNALLLAAALYVIHRYAKFSPFKKLLAILLIGLSPIIRYIEWQSYEVATCSFVIIAMVFWLNRSRKLSAFFLAIAGTMNPTAMAFGLFMIADYFWDRFCSSQKKFMLFFSICLKEWKDILLYALCFVPCLIPFIISYSTLGHFNPVAMIGVGSFQGIFDRFFAYIFDLNFGLLPYFILLLPLFIIICIVNIIKKQYHYGFTFLGVVTTILAYSLTVHINCGMTGIARYNSWLFPMIALTILSGMDTIVIGKALTRVSLCLVSVSLGWCTFVVGINFFSINQEGYTYFSPIAEFVLERYPALYNPLPSTFNSRINHVDGGYDISEPVIYLTEYGYVRKVLVPAGMSEDAAALLWTDDQYSLQKIKEEQDRVKDTTGFAYMNFDSQTEIKYGGEPYTLGTEILFTEENDGTEYFTFGISPVETNFAWSNGASAEMILQVQDDDCALTMDMGFSTVFSEPQRLIVESEGRTLYCDTVTADDLDISFIIPEDCVIDGRLELDITYPDAVNLQEQGYNDSRTIALGLKKIVISDSRKVGYTEYALGEMIPFTMENDLIRDYLIAGLSETEYDFAWTDSSQVELKAYLGDISKDLVLDLELQAVYQGKQRVTVWCGHSMIADITAKTEDKHIQILIPVEYVHDGKLDLVLRLPDAISPAEAEGSADTRKLALGIRSIMLSIAE